MSCVKIVKCCATYYILLTIYSWIYINYILLYYHFFCTISLFQSRFPSNVHHASASNVPNTSNHKVNPKMHAVNRQQETRQQRAHESSSWFRTLKDTPISEQENAFDTCFPGVLGRCCTRDGPLRAYMRSRNKRFTSSSCRRCSWMRSKHRPWWRNEEKYSGARRKRS